VEDVDRPDPVILYERDEPLVEVRISEHVILKMITQIDHQKAQKPGVFYICCYEVCGCVFSAHLFDIFEHSWLRTKFRWIYLQKYVLSTRKVLRTKLATSHNCFGFRSWYTGQLNLNVAREQENVNSVLSGWRDTTSGVPEDLL